VQDFDEPEPPPSPIYYRSRLIPPERIAYAEACNKILIEHGAVWGARRYEARYQARYRANYLIQLLTRLELKQRWQLRERTYKLPDGLYVWSVEYVSVRRSDAEKSTGVRGRRPAAQR
jgi:hypothetical protein